MVWRRVGSSVEEVLRSGRVVVVERVLIRPVPEVVDRRGTVDDVTVGRVTRSVAVVLRSIRVAEVVSRRMIEVLVVERSVVLPPPRVAEVVCRVTARVVDVESRALPEVVERSVTRPAEVVVVVVRPADVVVLGMGRSVEVVVARAVVVEVVVI